MTIFNSYVSHYQRVQLQRLVLPCASKPTGNIIFEDMFEKPYSLSAELSRTMMNIGHLGEQVEDDVVCAQTDHLKDLVGGDWNMTFIFPYIGDNHPN